MECKEKLVKKLRLISFVKSVMAILYILTREFRINSQHA